MSELCKKHKIRQVHGASQTPLTQGLVDLRNSRTVKGNILNILNERCESLGKWCFVLIEVAYKTNIIEHRAISQVPYKVVFGIFPRKEIPGRTEEDHTEESEQMTTMEEENAPILASKFNEPAHQNDLLPPSENTNLVQPYVADLQVVGPSVENPNL